MFAPVTLKMIEEAQPRPDDVCEIDGDQINEVSWAYRADRLEFDLSSFTDQSAIAKFLRWLTSF